MQYFLFGICTTNSSLARSSDTYSAHVGNTRSRLRIDFSLAVQLKVGLKTEV